MKKIINILHVNNENDWLKVKEVISKLPKNCKYQINIFQKND